MWNKYNWLAWLRGFRDGFEAALLPLMVFQFIRTLIFPTTFDVILLTIMFFLYFCFLRRWI